MAEQNIDLGAYKKLQLLVLNSQVRKKISQYIQETEHENNERLIIWQVKC